ncbi:hypothetical protein [Microcoleus sp. FACHB-68]|uniref:hypothetical protein n=1 Tax=Microcoleus sp. FACHB-68 TaxID=2692826 RepID=UPI0016857FE9|nr:hypothetical protein [Microcoleus sp. FACHB-68]MBD1937024.1 hypothetical protein [Microcoleus sp. FACHB-68]
MTFALIGMRVSAQAESADLVGGNIPNQTKFKINSVEPEILVIADPIFSQKQAVLLPESSEPESSTNLSNTTAT